MEEREETIWFDWANSLDYLFMIWENIDDDSLYEKYKNIDMNIPACQNRMIEELYTHYTNHFDPYQKEELNKVLTYMIENESFAKEKLGNSFLLFPLPDNTTQFLTALKKKLCSSNKI